MVPVQPGWVQCRRRRPMAVEGLVAAAVRRAGDGGRACRRRRSSRRRWCRCIRAGCRRRRSRCLLGTRAVRSCALSGRPGRPPPGRGSAEVGRAGRRRAASVVAVRRDRSRSGRQRRGASAFTGVASSRPTSSSRSSSAAAYASWATSSPGRPASAGPVGVERRPGRSARRRGAATSGTAYWGAGATAATHRAARCAARRRAPRSARRRSGPRRRALGLATVAPRRRSGPARCARRRSRAGRAALRRPRRARPWPRRPSTRAASAASSLAAAVGVPRRLEVDLVAHPLDAGRAAVAAARRPPPRRGPARAGPAAVAASASDNRHASGSETASAPTARWLPALASRERSRWRRAAPDQGGHPLALGGPTRPESQVAISSS